MADRFWQLLAMKGIKGGSEPTPTQEKTVDLDMANGNQVITPDDGYLLTKGTVVKPDTFVPANIKKGVNIGGVVGEMESADSLAGIIDGSLTHFVMPPDITKIADYRFYNFKNLETVDLGNVQDIGNYAFDNAGLTSIIIPKTTKKIGSYAFDTNSNATHLSGSMDGDINDSAFSNLTNIIECNLSNFKIHTLGQSAFRFLGRNRANQSQNIVVLDFSNSDFTLIRGNCFSSSQYLRIILPKSIQNIESYAFSYLSNCELYFPQLVPPTVSNSNVWSSTTNNKIFVSYNSINAYKTATNWTTQASNIIGYVGAGVLPVGSELPTINEEGYALTWFSDKACTVSATTVENADAIYYCTSGTEKIGYGVKSIETVSCSVTISDGTKTYRQGDGILAGTVVTITTSATESGFVPYLLQVNGEDFTSGGTFTVNEDLNITAVYWDGKNIPLQPVFGDNSWAMIRHAFRNGLASGLWAVGDQKEVTLGDGNTYHIRIADMQSGRYNLTDGSGTTNGVFEFVECLPTGYPINSSQVTDGDVTAYTAGGWAMCQMKNTTLGITVWGLLPHDMKLAISEITLNEYSYSAPSPRESTNKLFLPAETEIFMDRHYSAEGSQTGCVKYDRFDYYASATIDSSLPLRQKYMLGEKSSTYWWLRSPNAGNKNNFCAVNTTGEYNADNATSSRGVAPCFAI